MEQFNARRISAARIPLLLHNLEVQRNLCLILSGKKKHDLKHGVCTRKQSRRDVLCITPVSFPGTDARAYLHSNFIYSPFQ